jgi:hypothetical protein
MKKIRNYIFWWKAFYKQLSIRHLLIVLLAGKQSFLLNTDVKNDKIYMNDGGLIWGCNVDGYKMTKTFYDSNPDHESLVTSKTK